MTLATVRADLMDSFSAISCAVYDYAPETVIPPAAVCIPADPYLEIQTIGSSNTRVLARFQIVALVAMNNNQASLLNLENLIADMLAAIPSGYIVSEVSAPVKTQVGPSDLLTATMVVEVATTL